MSDVEYLTGTEGDDVLDGGAGLNDYTGGLGNDFINGMEGDNTLHFDLGDGVDSVSFAPPRTYQFADFLTAAMDGLGELENHSGNEYTNDYFADADRMLTRSLPPEIAEVLQHFRSNGGTDGIVDPADAQIAFTALIDWINAPTRMVIEFGAGIELSDLSVQIGSIAAYGSPAEFSVAVNGTEGFLFQLGRTDNVATDMTGPPILDIEFHFADGSVATAADLLGSPDAGVIGQQFGTSDDDFLRASLSSDQIYAEEGNDKVDAGAGFDTVFGGDGNDALAGGSGGDYLFGEDGNDVLAAGRDGGVVSGGAGNDVYVFNRGDGVVSIDNTGNWPGEVDTISFGKDVDPESLVASVDPNSGFLTLRIVGTDDQLTMPWFDASNGMAEGAQYIVARVQFIDAQGHARVFDLQALVASAFPDPASSNPDGTVQLFGEDAAAYELTGTVAPAGGLHAVNYAINGDLFLNLAPTSSAVADQATQEDSGFSFAIPANTFVDPEGETLSFAATQANGDPLPAWLQFDATTGTFTGTPGNADVGTLAVKVTASDSLGQSTSQTFNLNVENVNDAPTATPGVGDAAATEDAVFAYTLAADTFADIDVGDSLSYSASMADGSALPSWLHFDAATLTFSGTPENADVGMLSVKVTASDGEESVSKAVDINVANTNDAPTATAGTEHANATEDAAFSYELPAATFADVDLGDSVTYSATMADGTALPSWLQFDTATGAFSGTPANGDVGSLSVKVTATDSAAASVTKDLDINVANTNDAPTATAGGEHAGATEDAAFSYTLPVDTFADVDLGDSLTYSATMADGAALPSWLHFDAASGTFSGTPENGDVGSLSIKVTATDTAHASVSKDLDISVANTNDAPTATAGDAHASATEDASFSYALAAGTFADVDLGDSLTYSATMADGSALPSWLQFDAATGAFSGTPANADVGLLSVHVTATDAAHASATKALDISIANANDAPTVAHPIADQTATEDAQFNFALPGSVFADVDLGDSMRLSATLENGAALPSWLSFDAATGVFSGTPGNSDVGTLGIRVTARDQAGTSVSDVFNLAIANTNDAPTLVQPVADQHAVAGASFNLLVPSNMFADVDARDNLSVTARLSNGDPLPAWLSFNPNTRTLSGTPATNGTFNIQITATDLSGASVSDVFALNVDAPSVPPSEPGKTLIGGNADDRLVGGSGNDTISGGKGKDQLIGGAGDDILKFSEDAKWSKTTRKNAGSPGVSGSGDSVNPKDSRRSYDVFDGGTGYDMLVGTSGNDAILLDDSSSPAAVSGPRIKDIEQINADGGNDIVDLTSKRYSYGDVTINGGSGNDVLWSSGGNDVVRGDSGNDKMNGGAGNDYLDGGSGNDELVGGQGIDILQGGSGKDKLSDTSSNSLLDGGKDNDSLTSGSNNSFMIGGKGNDDLVLGGGYDIIAFNKGDGRDTVSSKYGDAALSLGGGIRYQDLSLRRSGEDLVLEIGSSDRITFEKWYDGRKYQAVSKLQVVAESMSDFNPNGSDSLRDDKIETFDFKELVETFDAARAQNHGLSKWTLTNAMAQFQLGGSDSSALGGDLGYQYGLNGTLAGIAVAAAQEVTGSTKLGKQAQSLQSQTDLQDGAIKLT